jgi:hypothetical protein
LFGLLSQKSSIIYTTAFTENWMNGIGLFINMLNGMNKFNSQMKDADLQTVTPLLLDLSFVEKMLDATNAARAGA